MNGINGQNFQGKMASNVVAFRNNKSSEPPKKPLKEKILDVGVFIVCVIMLSVLIWLAVG
jgi:hypothetical protein